MPRVPRVLVKGLPREPGLAIADTDGARGVIQGSGSKCQCLFLRACSESAAAAEPSSLSLCGDFRCISAVGQSPPLGQLPANALRIASQCMACALSLTDGLRAQIYGLTDVLCVNETELQVRPQPASMQCVASSPTECASPPHAA